jgi:hypothetical protein
MLCTRSTMFKDKNNKKQHTKDKKNIINHTKLFQQGDLSPIQTFASNA